MYNQTPCVMLPIRENLRNDFILWIPYRQPYVNICLWVPMYGYPC